MTVIGEGPSGSKSLNKTPGVSEVIKPSSKTAAVSAIACGGVLMTVVSMEMVRELLASKPSALVLPAKSENLELATEIMPLLVLSSRGMNWAEYEVPLPEKLERVPPEKKMSDLVKLVENSESAKESIAISPALRDVASELREMDGADVSLVVVSTAWVAGFPAKSLTSAVMERVPSAREERSRFERE